LRIIDPLTSRCAKFRFKPIEISDGLAKLDQICTSEQITFSDNPPLVLQHLLTLTHGDLRKSITWLQSVCLMGKPVGLKTIDEVGGVVPDDVVEGLVQAVTGIKNVEDVVKKVEELVIRPGYPVAQIIYKMVEWLERDSMMESLEKAQASLVLALADHALNEGADEHLQLLGALTSIQELRTLKTITA